MDTESQKVDISRFRLFYIHTTVMLALSLGAAVAAAVFVTLCCTVAGRLVSREFFYVSWVFISVVVCGWAASKREWLLYNYPQD